MVLCDSGRCSGRLEVKMYVDLMRVNRQGCMGLSKSVRQAASKQYPNSDSLDSELCTAGSQLVPVYLRPVFDHMDT